MFDWIANPEAWIALVSLSARAIVLGIDNIIFLSILAGRLPPQRRNGTRLQGLSLRY
jgi:predicted tellurium resistance membrane protein TerC